MAIMAWSLIALSYIVTILLLGVHCSPTFSNPVIWNDLADLDVFRVNDTYYYSASSMHFSPGAPLLHSKDLVDWEYLGFSVRTWTSTARLIL